MSESVTPLKTDTSVQEWRVGGLPPQDASDRTGVVALDYAISYAARERHLVTVPFHLATKEHVDRVPRVVVNVPEFRGKSAIHLLSWLVTNRIGTPGVEVDWVVERRQLVRVVQRSLMTLGWFVENGSGRRSLSLRGRPQGRIDRPNPSSFVTTMGKRRLKFAADYGVFSQDRIDDGTKFLFEVAAERGPVRSVADIGTGYGPLAIGLLANGLARQAMVSEIDSVALWLAEINAKANRVELWAHYESDPANLPASDLTTCNLPTHASAVATDLLVRGLAHRSRCGTVLAVVHRSLVSRYRQHFTSMGAEVLIHDGPTHAVVEVAGRQGQGGAFAW